MSFYIFKNGGIANKSEMNENVYHILEGTRLPMGGMSLTATDSVYNIGGISNMWYAGYFNNIDMADQILYSACQTWFNYFDYSATETITTLSFNVASAGPLSENINNFEVFARFDTTDKYFYMVLNAVVTNTYKNMPLKTYGSTSYVEVDTTTTSSGFEFELCNTGASSVFAHFHIHVGTSTLMSVIGEVVSIGITNTAHRYLDFKGNLQTTNFLTQLKLTGTFNPGSYFQLWEPQ